jgi:hypothetical protein
MQSNNKRNAFNKSDGRKRRNRKRPKPPGRMQVYSAAGRQALRDINTLRRYINTEMHYKDTNGTFSATTTYSLVLLNGLNLGDSSTTRTGQSIKMDRLDLRFYITANATTVLNLVRVIVVVDRQPNAAAMTAADLLVNTNPNSPYTFGSQNRFICLYDENFALSYGGNGIMTKSLTLTANQHVTFKTTDAGDITDIVTNSLYMLVASKDLADPPSYTYYARLWFVDN